MKKCWITQKPNRPGWYVCWYYNGYQKSKQLPSKTLAQQFKRQKEYELNGDIYTEPISAPIDETIEKYINYKTNVKRLAAETIRSIRISLNQFVEAVNIHSCTHIDQQAIDTFIAARSNRSPATVNKAVRNISAFVNWCIEYRYTANRKLKFTRQHEAKRPVVILPADKIEKLIDAAADYSLSWHIRILLALTTGRRQKDIENINIPDIDLVQKQITFVESKTGTAVNMPMHPALTAPLKKFIGKRTGKLFTDKYHHEKWEAIREAAGCDKLKYHDLRKTFASMILQAGYSTAVVQKLLGHSTAALTNEVYSNIDPIRQEAVESIPVRRRPSKKE